MGQPNFALKKSVIVITGNTFANDKDVLKDSLEGNVREMTKKDDWLEQIGSSAQDELEPAILTTTKQEGTKQEVKAFSRANSNSTPIAKWEGVVISVDYENKKFHGELRDILNYDSKDALIAEFDFDDIEESKHNLIKEGSIFYWNIYDENRGQGKNRGINYIYFREIMPIWRSYNFDNISSDVVSTHKAIFDDCSS